MTAGSDDRGARVEVRRLLQASPDDVFDAWTDAEGMADWMRPGPTVRAECQLEPRVGGRLHIRMFGANGEVIDHEGEFRVLDRPRRLAFTWISEGTGRRETLVTVELTEVSGGTELVLVHEQLPAPAADPHRGGWTSIVDKLADAVARSARGAD